ncbi:fluoride efflux transporter CrcB [Muricauda ruestringensis]|uniref:Fluoride-specific ion channel FluC n=1 Tax=Flagellimonas marinaquae TaxID=254955 RepID=A0AA48HK22_9FLAO|nr:MULTISPECIES: fluoride efflux transporter CrcB [Allomuricauda]MCA0957911.1 fluoride efflux transporter CrcB [Allomuricauda ruestringensis]USD24255.1 fluoride efflux transporter CrcB [Allomuricauda aquimarina]BDW93120.1 putative fluoride ion transporter CrcB [Allomuricauda aquimarina]
MKQALLVFLGGGFGSVLRYLVSKPLNSISQNFFIGTFTVNILGCLIIGLVLGFSAKGDILSENNSLLLATGFCGGFTTFSAFAFEKHTFLKSGDYLNFAIYMMASIILGILSVVLGLWLAKQT